MTEKILIMTVGLPRSGKTTWARQQGLPIVNPDSIRLALHGKAYITEAEPMVWAIARYMVRALFLAGHDKIILDATNTTIERRSKWFSSDWEVEYQLFLANKEVCIERARESGKEDFIPVIEFMEDNGDFRELGN